MNSTSIVLVPIPVYVVCTKLAAPFSSFSQCGRDSQPGLSAEIKLGTLVSGESVPWYLKNRFLCTWGIGSLLPGELGSVYQGYWFFGTWGMGNWVPFDTRDIGFFISGESIP